MSHAQLPTSPLTGAPRTLLPSPLLSHACRSTSNTRWSGGGVVEVDTRAPRDVVNLISLLGLAQD
ncbi:hypothetical protein BD779DRAFT_1563075, partial [Infundibulicybe gibba]